MPLVGDSGNGGHALPIDLPNGKESKDLLKRVLEGLADMLDLDGLHVDQNVFNV